MLHEARRFVSHPCVKMRIQKDVRNLCWEATVMGGLGNAVPFQFADEAF